MNYSRAAFRAWLLTLPDEPRFWGGTSFRYTNTPNTCPIGEFLGCGSFEAKMIDRELVAIIDISVPWSDGRGTPSQVISAIDALEPPKKEKKGIPPEILQIFNVEDFHRDRTEVVRSLVRS